MEEVTPSLISFKPSPNEREATNYLFKKADSDHLGVLTGDKAVMFFNHAGLPPVILGEIWEATDPDNTGFLTPERFGVACRLIGHAQSSPGAEVKSEWIGTPAPFPSFEGYPIPSHLLPTSSSIISSPPRPVAQQLQPQATGSFNTSILNLNSATQGGTVGISISQEEKVRYSKLFLSSGPVGGLLDGDKARDIFIKSKLPYDKLGQIWSLADTHSRGSLDVADFTIGMHLIQHTMNNDLPNLPSVLSPALYASAISMNPPIPTSPVMSNRGRTSVGGMTGSPLRAGSISGGNIAGGARFISPQSTGQQQKLQQQPYPYSPQTLSFPPQQQQQQQQQVQWDIDAKEKAESDTYFDGLDPMRSGFIDGEAAVGFFSQSGLDIGILAKVWDLADIRGSGALNKDEFAVALRLIRDRVAGKEIPQVLPLSMIPPSLRPQAPAAPQRDLLDLLDEEPTPLSPLAPTTSSIFTPASRLAPQSTGTSTYAQSALQGTIFPQATGTTTRSTGTLTPQATGFSGNFAAAPATVQGSNFFEDNDIADQQSKLATDNATLANLQAEHSAATTVVTTLSTRRAELETSLASTTSAINELQVSLSQARAAHETERGMVESLESRHKEQADLLARARHELITAESDLSGLRVERTEIEGNYLRDKESVREMKKKMAEVALETSSLQEVLEKLKKDARQQKGLVAISKKQLLTAEGEKEKVASQIVEEKQRPIEVEEAEEIAAPVAVSREIIESSPFDHFTPSLPISLSSASPFDHHPLSNAATGTQIPLPVSPPVNSPAGSIRSTNPFERMNSSLHQLVTSSPPSFPVTQSSNSTSSSTLEPEPKLETREVVKDEEVSHSPLAAVSAVGLGAVAVIGAAGATVAGVLGFRKGDTDKKDEEKKKDEEERKEEDVEEIAKPSEFVEAEKEKDVVEEEKESVATPIAHPKEEKEAVVAAEVDPFGLPNNSVSPTSPDSHNFDQGFGDDFTASPVVLSHAHESTTPATDFDHEFKEIDHPTTYASAVVSSFAAAEIHEPLPVAHLAPPTPVTKDEVANKEEEDEEEEAEDSSDDDEGIEDATASSRPSGTTSTSEKTSEVALSDSGESFVHVPSVTNETETETESKFPALETLESAVVPTIITGSEESNSNLMQGARSVSPTPDYSSSEPFDHSPSAIFDDPLPIPISSSISSPTSEEAPPTPTKEFPSILTATKKRAAPPPPPTRNSLSTSTSTPIASSQLPSTSSLVTSPISFFDDAFSTTATTSSSVPGVATGMDDFDDAFDDLPPPTSVIQQREGNRTSIDQDQESNDFDTFDDEFSFKPDFSNKSDNTLGASTNSRTSSTSAFEDSFANFDSAFDPITTTSTTPKPSTSTATHTAPDRSFSFDDTFGSETLLPTSTGSALPNYLASPSTPSSTVNPPVLPARTTPTKVVTPLEDNLNDVEGVKTIMEMGFTRAQALTSLMKYDYDVSRALNSLLG